MSIFLATFPAKITGRQNLHRISAVVTFACCDQTHCISSGFVSGDRIPYLGLRFAR
jgi:hypothetical protein